MKKFVSMLLAAVLCLSLAGCGGGAASSAAPAVSSPAPAQSQSAAPAQTTAPDPTVAPVQRTELRAMWVSYLEWRNVDFTTAETFKADFDELLDNCASIGLNAVIAQVRPFGDALYPSNLFPWSICCTGSQGLDPGYDPLAIMVEEAHARGIQLHAWVTPYRLALNADNPGALAADNLSATHPEWVKNLDSALYLDPSSEDVMEYITDGVREILKNYPVDGIQFDDYFYPTTQDSFDDAEYAAYTGGLERNDWRRENVNRLVQKVYAAVKEFSPDCVFGVSPQGNNDNNYNGQFSDVAAWMAAPGYVDYVMPQLYWGYHYTLSGGSDQFAYENVSKEWAALPRDASVALYFGLGAYRVGTGDGGSNADSTDVWNTGRALADMVTDLRALNVDGYALYRYDFVFGPEADAERMSEETAALLAANTAD